MDSELDKPESDSSGDAGVTVPEEFQTQTHALVHKATKPQLAHVRDRVYQREDELRQKDVKATKGTKGGGKGPSMLSTEGMP